MKLKPGEKAVVPFTIRVPAPKAGEAPPQGIFVGMVSFSPQAENDQSTVNLIISVSVYLTIRGTEKPSAEVKEFGLRKFQNDVQAAVLLENTGNVHLRPAGRVDVFDREGNKVAEGVFPESRPAYPTQTRGALLVFPTPAWKKGYYRAEAHMDLWGKTVKKDFFFEWNPKKGLRPLEPERAAKLFPAAEEARP